MTGYKIYYGNYGYDCWGRPEWCCWYEYDNVVYTNEDKAIEAMEDAKEQFPEREFELHEIELQ